MKWLTVRVNDARLDALIARGYLAANERADATAVQAALQAFLADRALRRFPLGRAGRCETQTYPLNWGGGLRL